MAEILSDDISGIVGQVLLEEFGGVFRHVETTLNLVALTTVEIAKGDPERVSLTLINMGSDAIFVAPSSRIASNLQGILLSPSGGFLIMTMRDDFVLPILSWHARAVDVTTLYVLEVKRDVENNFGGV